LGEFSLTWAALQRLRKKPEGWGYFFPRKGNVLNLTKMGWATFWATLSQTHLDTLACVGINAAQNGIDQGDQGSIL
jgi:hypothetical protein